MKNEICYKYVQKEKKTKILQPYIIFIQLIKRSMKYRLFIANIFVFDKFCHSP